MYLHKCIPMKVDTNIYITMYTQETHNTQHLFSNHICKYHIASQKCQNLVADRAQTLLNIWKVT